MKDHFTEKQKIAFINGGESGFDSVFTTFHDCPYSSEEYRLAWCFGLYFSRERSIILDGNLAMNMCKGGLEFGLYNMVKPWKSFSNAVSYFMDDLAAACILNLYGDK